MFPHERLFNFARARFFSCIKLQREAACIKSIRILKYAIPYRHFFLSTDALGRLLSYDCNLFSGLCIYLITTTKTYYRGYHSNRYLATRSTAFGQCTI